MSQRVVVDRVVDETERGRERERWETEGGREVVRG